MTPSPREVTQLLVDWSNGDQAALDKLIPLVYEELHRMAKRHIGRERPGHTLQTTALVNEAYLRLIDQRSVRWQNRAHFFSIAARLMRRILIDHARAHHYAKRGGVMIKVSLGKAIDVSKERATELVLLDDAMTALAALDPRKSQVVELRFFGGMSVEETAEVLGVSSVTVMRDWSTAKAWLHRAMAKGVSRKES
jgi:RNA polymerase sigma factor (TIGR02999 family)